MIIKRKKMFLTLLLFVFFVNFNNTAEALPDVSAQSYIVIDSDSGRIIASRNPNEKLPIASTTKILTTILAIESIENTVSVEQKIQVPPECAGIEGSSIYLKPKQMVSIKDLLYGTMLRSGNDAASTLAAYAGAANKSNFVDMMNEKAKELGALNSNFTNPNGLHDNDHYSTAYDLAIISRHAMKNKLFKEISSAENYKATSMNTYFYNKNKVVHQYEYGNGIKIGYTKAAGRCLVASAEKDGTEIIVVVLNDNNWFQDSYKVLDWAFDNYNSYSIVEEGQFAGRTPQGEPVFISEGFSYLLTEEEKDKIRFEATVKDSTFLSDIKKICGTYSIYLEDELIYTGRLVKN